MLLARYKPHTSPLFKALGILNNMGAKVAGGGGCGSRNPPDSEKKIFVAHIGPFFNRLV